MKESITKELFMDLVNGAQGFRATGHSAHGLEQDLQVPLQPLDDFQ